MEVGQNENEQEVNDGVDDYYRKKIYRMMFKG